MRNRAGAGKTTRRVGASALRAVPAEVAQEMLRLMLLVRALDVRSFQLNRQGKIPFALGSEGHEAVQAGAGMTFRRGVDLLVPYYRDTGLCIAAGLTPLEVLYSQFARAADVNGGRQFPSHWSGRRYGIMSISSILAAHMTHAVGAAYAMKLRRDVGRVVYCSFGEGTTSEGEWHEAMNFASVHKLPMVMLCQNNGWAVSTPQARQMAVVDVAERASGYGMPGRVVDGMDPVAVYETVSWAREEAESGRGPVLVEAKCQRMRAHSTDDDDRSYRSADDIEHSRSLDPVENFSRRIVADGVLDDLAVQRMKREIGELVDRWTDEAEAEPYPPTDDLYRNVVEGPWQPWQ
jgi:2-oxoisovalerate dehydrogenase E1 component alpha subunit